MEGDARRREGSIQTEGQSFNARARNEANESLLLGGPGGGGGGTVFMNLAMSNGGTTYDSDIHALRLTCA